MTKLTRRAVILAKEEVTYGTDPTPTGAANAILALDPTIKAVGDKLERNPAMATLGRLSPLIGKRWVELSFSVELKHSGTVDVAPRIGDLLEACGMAETVNAVVDVTYEPASSSLKSCTIYIYLDGILHKVTGCRGSFEIVSEVGQIVKINFTFQGLDQAPTDTALPTATYESTIPPVFLSASFTFDAITTFKVQALQLNIQNEIAPSEDINAATGFAGFIIAGRNPIGSFNPEVEPIATYDFHAKWTSANKVALSVVVGSVAGNKITISAPKVTLDEMNKGDRGGILIYDVPITLGIDSGDDSLKLVFS